ncbi:threonine-phosphate decarboxylase CobD [Steroidobacter denitrificans]|uniref:threonine-phosphate decarboxylase CobD n=1 Tax=Steroidobacter denitrificans TaxID=465721 RepID=UPI0008316DF6|nr:threonine-phosphate decarboxylase CobD [Steroidobacter denitrificans]
MVATSLDVFREHGGRIDAASALFPLAPRPWIDLSTGISPWAYPHADLAHSVFARLPEADHIAELEHAAATAFGVEDPSQVVAVPGTDLALRLLEPIFHERKVAVVRPGYSGHLLAWKHSSVTEATSESLEQAAGSNDVIILANPNNPDGRTICPDRLRAVAKRLAARGGMLVIDEAYADIVPENSLCTAASDGILVFRSFGKFFGLAGLRLGFVVTSRHAMSFRQLIGDWPVCGPAVDIGIAAYRDSHWQSAQRQRLLHAGADLDALLLATGFELKGGTPLYRLVRCADADALFRRLAMRGILIRPLNEDSRLVRIGLPADDDQWTRLYVALQ